MTPADMVRKWFTEVWREGGEKTVVELMDEHVVGKMEGTDIHNRAEFLIARRQLMDTFPDISIVVDDLIAEGDKVVVRWSVTGTHQGNGLGIPATGQAVGFRGMSWVEFEGGKVVRGWDCWNLGGLVQSLASASAR
ncbi:MAG TPA: ester cyclase [Vicinamibacterales bacterium]|nr:ester cyclase [Vicinamibacterales bacterium]